MTIRSFFITAFLILSVSPLGALDETNSDSSAGFEERFDFANGLYNRGMYAMALTEFDRVVNEYAGLPKEGLARLRAAECLYFLERYPEAITRFEALTQAFPDAPFMDQTRRRLGEAYYLEGNKTKAKEMFALLLNASSATTQNIAHYYSGKIAFEVNDFDTAKNHFEKVSLTDDGSLNSFSEYYLGEILLEQGNAKSARDHFETAHRMNIPELAMPALLGLGRSSFENQDYQTSGEYYLEAYKLRPDSPSGHEAFLKHLESFFASGDYEALLDTADKAKDTVSKDVWIQIQFLKARTFRVLKDYRKANEVYAEVMSAPELSPENKEMARMGRVEILMDLGDSTTALDTIEGMNADELIFKERWSYLKADALKRSGLWEKAIDEIEGHVTRFPESEYADKVMLSRGYVYLEKGDLGKAREAFNAFVERYPKHKFAEKSLSDMILIDMKMKLLDQAIEDSKRFLETFPDSHLAKKVHYRLASLYTDTDHYTEATRSYKVYLDKYPEAAEDHEVYFFLGYNHQLAGNVSQALEFYEKVEPDFVRQNIMYTTLKNQAYCQVLLGRFDAASATYERLIIMFPQNDLNHEIYFWLAEHYRKAKNPSAIRVLMEKFELKNDDETLNQGIAFFLGESYRMEGNFTEALKYYQEHAGEEGIFEASSYHAQALCQTELRLWDEAEKSFQDALASAGDDSSQAIRSRMALADLHDRKGDSVEAAKTYLSVAILYDDKRWVPEALYKAEEAFRKANLPQDAKRVQVELMERFPDHPLAQEMSQ